MGNRKLMSLGLLGCLAFGIIVFQAILRAPRLQINQESFARIHLGMTRQEVEQIVGGPPGDHGPGEVGLVYLGGNAYLYTIRTHRNVGGLASIAPFAWVSMTGVSSTRSRFP